MFILSQLLSSGLQQRGDDTEGILGFLRSDILSEVKRVKDLVSHNKLCSLCPKIEIFILGACTQKCFYCKRKSANIGCCHTKCRRTIHLECGLRHECQFQFIDTFRSFCHKHVMVRRDQSYRCTEICGICLDNMGKYGLISSVLASCCNKWFHKNCLVQVAQNAGYYFKCPLCNCCDKFRHEMSVKGIFIPDR